MNFSPPGIPGLRIYYSDQPVPLKSVDINAYIKGIIANVTAVLIYRNVEDKTIEVVYKFPTDESSAVYRFEAEIDGRVIVAECQERTQAKRTYEEAMGIQRTVAYMEEADYISDIFSIKVGNIPPGGEVKITFGYVTDLKQLAEAGVVQFTLHTALLNPRYNPAVESGGLENPSTVPYITDGTQPYDFGFRATVVNTGPIINIVSGKDELNVEYNGNKTEAVVSLLKPFVPDHDLSLEISYSDPLQPHVIIEKGVPTEEGLLKEDILMLNFFPGLTESDFTSNHEYIIVVDRSGSMEGPRIRSAKETLLLFLKSLPTGCYFNIIGFGSDFDKLFPEGSRELTEENLNAAVEYQTNILANFGGTEILEPLSDIYSKPVMTTHSRQLFILTDGEVSNTSAVIAAVQKNSHNTRVFTFGIGQGASTALVRGMARAGRGTAVFIKEGDRMQSTVIKSLESASQIGISDLHLEWELEGSPKLIQIPKELPALFSGDRLKVYAISTDQAALEGKVHLKGRIGQRELNFELEIHGGQLQKSDDVTLPLHRLAAKSQIHQLQDEGKDKNKEAIILLSTASNIISHHTAMVAVDKEKSAKVTGQAVKHEVPHGLDPNVRYDIRGLGGWRPLIIQGRVRMMGAHPWVGLRGGGALPTPEERDRVEITGYMKLVQLQNFCGSWKLDFDLVQALEVTLEKMKSSQPQAINEEVWSTVLALVVLKTKYSDNRDEWRMIERKALKWLDDHQVDSIILDSLINLAKEAIIN